MSGAKVGLIGAGYMGHGVGRNVVEKGFALTVLAHRNREAIDDLVRRGAVEAGSAAGLAAASDIVILCVPGARQVDELVRRPGGLAAGANTGLVIVDCTTAEPSTLEWLAHDFAGQGISFVDAPLGRSPKEAWEGRLSTMVGADDAVFEMVRPVLACFAVDIQRVGRLGNGHRLKMVNNLISMGMAALFAEALVLTRKAGLGTADFDALVRSSRMHCAFYETFMGWARDGHADAHRFAIGAGRRSLDEVAGFARAVEMDSKMLRAAAALFRQVDKAGAGGDMLPELPRSVAALSRVELSPSGPKP